MARVRWGGAVKSAPPFPRSIGKAATALAGDDNYPYAVPISYVYDGEKIYFHCAKSGHKLDAIQRNEKVSFCVVDQDKIVPDEYTSYFRSVIVFGRVEVIKSEKEKRAAIEKLAIKYAPKRHIHWTEKCY